MRKRVLLHGCRQELSAKHINRHAKSIRDSFFPPVMFRRYENVISKTIKYKSVAGAYGGKSCARFVIRFSEFAIAVQRSKFIVEKKFVSSLRRIRRILIICIDYACSLILVSYKSYVRIIFLLHLSFDGLYYTVFDIINDL